MTTRFSGCDWATEKREINIIGAGGIGSWTALNLARIGHTLLIYDGDNVDVTNVQGGQMYRRDDVGKNKASAILSVCRDFGCEGIIYDISAMLDREEDGFSDDSLVVCAVDNMAARKMAFEMWLESKSPLFIDGRLLVETMEVFCIDRNNIDAIKEYRDKHLFDDSEVEKLDCTTKQSTFAAMTISGLITATICNHLTNIALGMDFRPVPFYQRMHFPIFDYKLAEVEQLILT